MRCGQSGPASPAAASNAPKASTSASRARHERRNEPTTKPASRLSNPKPSAKKSIRIGISKVRGPEFPRLVCRACGGRDFGADQETAVRRNSPRHDSTEVRCRFEWPELALLPTLMRFESRWATQVPYMDSIPGQRDKPRCSRK